MKETPHRTRRAVLAGSAAVAGTVALAACGSSDDTDQPSGPAPTPPSDTSSSGSGSSGSSGSSSDSIASLDDVPVGEATAVDLPGGDKAVLFRADDTKIACFSALCTHKGCPVAAAGDKLICPCHESVFDAETGEVLSGPAEDPLPPVKVRIAEGEIVADA